MKSKIQMLYDIEQLGYSISIEKKNNTCYVTFSGKHSLHDYKLPHTYGLDYTNQEIKKDCVNQLIEWAGLYYETKLTYKE